MMLPSVHFLAEGSLYMLMSDLTHRSLACKAHFNMYIENALYQEKMKFAI